MTDQKISRALVLAALSGALAMASLAGPAMAEGETGLASTFNNTVVTTYRDGRTAHLWINADGSYSGEGPRADPSSGHWSTQGQKLCFRQEKPIAVPFTYCTVMPQGGVGTAWDSRSVLGEPIRLQVARGR